MAAARFLCVIQSYNDITSLSSPQLETLQEEGRNATQELARRQKKINTCSDCGAILNDSASATKCDNCLIKSCYF